MKNITIGVTEANRKLALSTRYYAERGDGDQCGFGMTPADALASLEKRERASHLKFDDDLSEEIAFLALGAGEYLRDVCSRTDLSSFGGYMGFISEVVRCAPLLLERWRHMTDEFGGVWLYDVTERFGREWAQVLLESKVEKPEDFLECIIADEMQKWDIASKST